ncbi:hypothetical protein ACTZWT_20340 [Rhodopseudomonas sp. NSM]|uniref:hypothetical protein n=1 Tax=Rhodopseudomonas sp. NSM TaxID=3457630 RepID=UPI0040372942
MLKYITEKLVGQILPSVVATVIGAYVVNQYIVSRPDNAPPAAQTVKAEPAKVTVDPPALAAAPEHDSDKAEPAKSKTSTDKSAERSTSRGLRSAEKPAEKVAAKPAAATEPAKPVAKASEKASEKNADERREANRDPNEVLRAAVERLRAAEPVRPAPTEVMARTPEPVKVQEPFKVQEMPRVQEPPRSTAALQPLPPPVSIATPAASATMTTGTSFTGSVPPAATAEASFGGPRIAPPADIPSAAAMRGEGGASEQKPSVAEDVLLAAKSVFHAVLPR